MLQVSLRKRATNYRALLQKITYEDEASHAFSPPCIIQCTHKSPECSWNCLLRVDRRQINEALPPKSAWKVHLAPLREYTHQIHVVIHCSDSVDFAAASACVVEGAEEGEGIRIYIYIYI